MCFIFYKFFIGFLNIFVIIKHRYTKGVISIKNIMNILKNFCIVGSYLIYSMIAMIPVIIFKLDITNLTDQQYTLIMLFASIVYLLIIIFIYRKSLKTEFQDFKKNCGKYIKDNIIYWIIGLMIMFGTNLLISLIIPSGATNEQLVQNEILKYPLYMIWSACIFAPVIEEILFRKTIREIFPTNLIFVLMSGLLFGYIHTLTNFGSALELLYIIPYGAVGTMFAYMYVKTKNVFVPITFHAIHNTALVLLSIIVNLMVGV